MTGRQKLSWLGVCIGIALAHWGLSAYAFSHYRTALTYYLMPRESLFTSTVAFPQCFDRGLPPDLPFIASMLPVQSMLLAMGITLMLLILWRVISDNIIAYVSVCLLAGGCCCLCYLGILAVTHALSTKSIREMHSEQFTTLEAKRAWLNRLLPLPGQVLDTKYFLHSAELYAHDAVRIDYHFEIAIKIPPNEVDR